jgi:glutamate-5-semialdehyde dehydrogenase
MTRQEIMMTMLRAAHEAAAALANASTEQKNRALTSLAATLRQRKSEILAENAKDVARARAAGRSAALIDRLTLNEARIEGAAKDLEHVAALPDPVGEVFDLTIRPNGLRVGRMRIPLGVIGIVFEARPNVVIDAAALCLKSGNAVVLRGGSEASYSNNVLGDAVADACAQAGLPAAAAQVVRDTDRELVLTLLQARGLVDLVIPRGGEELIRFVDEQARVPVILHYKGVCHVYVDRDADLAKATPIIINAKVQRPGVCNAMETMLIDAPTAERYLPEIARELQERGVELRGCPVSRRIVPSMKEATEDDWYAEYLDLICAVRVVNGVDEAMAHIAKYGSSHTEAIITENYTTASRFIQQVNSSCVAVNASTRFNDGGELGLGAEIGISTTKLHAYGPMGLRELTTSKFVVLGSGQVRQ